MEAGAETSLALTKRALITGITGQDGSYLAELLLSKGYEVHGVVRRSSITSTERIEHLLQNPRLELHEGDLLDSGSLRRIIDVSWPSEIYNLASQSHPGDSFKSPLYTLDVGTLGLLRLLESARGHPTKIYQAGSSEMFGSSRPPQNEDTPFCPRSPYGISKLAAHWSARVYREAYGMFVTNGILFNHESPRRGETFVTRKITKALARIKVGRQAKVALGNLEARRDWGFAGDYVEGMWSMLQQDQPGDYVLATGESHSVWEFLEEACKYLDLDPLQVMESSSKYMRPSDVSDLRGDARKAKAVLGWKPKVSFKSLVRMMVDHDLRVAQAEGSPS